MDETICPVDFERVGQITDNELFDVLVMPLQSGVRLTAVMDCCHSGTGLDLPFSLLGQGGWQEEDNPAHSSGDVIMFSGCEDHDTSADASSYGRAAGAMTTAFVDTLKAQPHGLTFATMVVNMNHTLQQRSFHQRPQLTTSQRFDPNRVFDFIGAVGNANPTIGRHFRKKKHPRHQDMWDDSPLGGMLGGAIVSWVAMDMLFSGPSMMYGHGMMGAYDHGYGYGGYGHDPYGYGGGYGQEAYHDPGMQDTSVQEMSQDRGIAPQEQDTGYYEDDFEEADFGGGFDGY